MHKTTPQAKPYFRAFYRHNRLNFILAVALIVLSTGQMLFFSWALGEIINLVSAGQLERLPLLTAATLLVLLLSLGVDSAMYWCKTRFIHKALRQYKDLAFSRIAAKGISAFSRESTGKYLSALTNDVGSVEENYLNRTILLVFQVFAFLGAVTMMLCLSWQLTLAAVVLSAVPLAVSLGMGGELARRERALSDANERFLTQVKDFLGGFSVIKSFKAEDQVEQLFRRSNAATEEVKRRRRWWECLLTALSQGSAGLTQFGVGFLGAYLAFRGAIAPGTILIVINLCNYIIQPIQVVPQYLSGRRAARALVEKLAQAVEENTSRSGEKVEPVLRQGISLQNVTFGYTPGEDVLRGLTLTFRPGGKYAVVGGSGAGKSTLLQLLMGAYDSYRGSITVDGKELRDIDPDSLYDLESLIGQEVFLFDDTIARNITLFRDFSPDRVKGAAEGAGLAPLLEEKGMDYPCGENGGNLSGGERQRVAIARCLLRGTPVLLMDEATAALDNQTAFSVVDGILDLEGLTRVVVTHRLEQALLERYDAIYVLRHGQLCEAGTFRELMARKEYFYSLFTVANG